MAFLRVCVDVGEVEVFDFAGADESGHSRIDDEHSLWLVCKSSISMILRMLVDCFTL